MRKNDASTDDASAKLARIYAEAAKAQEECPDYSCNTLSRVAIKHGYKRWHSKPREIYRRTFEPSRVWCEPDYDQQNIRVLMLCFMAAMVEAGDA